MIGFISCAHQYHGLELPSPCEEINSIGIYLENGTTFELCGAKSYEIEQAVLSAFADEDYDDVEWWAYSPGTEFHIGQQMPELGEWLGPIMSSEGTIFLLDYQVSYDDLAGPLAWARADYETFKAVKTALTNVGADITSKIDRFLAPEPVERDNWSQDLLDLLNFV